MMLVAKAKIERCLTFRCPYCYDFKIFFDWPDFEDWNMMCTKCGKKSKIKLEGELKCPYCDVMLENNDIILEEYGGITWCINCENALKVDALKSGDKNA